MKRRRFTESDAEAIAARIMIDSIHETIRASSLALDVPVQMNGPTIANLQWKQKTPEEILADIRWAMKQYGMEDLK